MKITLIFVVVVIVWMCCVIANSEAQVGRHLLQLQADREEKIKKHLTVTTILNRPLMMQKEQTNRSPENDRYEGFLVDMLQKLSERLNFTYTIKPVTDGKYGVQDSAGRWNGMVGEVVNGVADIAVADLTITATRKSAVDFTNPYMTSGIGIIMKKPSSPSLNKLFLMPFASDVWISAIVAFSVMSALLFLMGRVSSSEWISTPSSTSGSYNRHNNLNFCNSLWFSVGSITQQGSRVAPRGVATRILSATWWIFCFFFIACYIANLAAILVHQLETSARGAAIQSVEDLERQTAVKYGTIRGGSTWNFFRTAQIDMYQRMFAFMESTSPSPYANSYTEGVERVKQGNYAMFMESASIEYMTERDCDLMQVGGLLDYRGYGIAMPKNSPLMLHAFTFELLKLQEEGTLLVLRKKWWSLEEGSCKAESQKVFTYPGNANQYNQQGKSSPGSCNAVASILNSHANDYGFGVRIKLQTKTLHCSACLPCSGQRAVYVVCLCRLERCAEEGVPWLGKSCPTEIKTEVRGSLTWENVNGIFVILILGCILALIIGIVELFWRAKQTSKEEGGSLCDEVMRELKFGLCGGNKGPSGPGDGIILQRQDTM